MNYRKVYMAIINHARAQARDKSTQPLEAHHILPKSMFPLWADRDSNKVLLTPREHYFCHQLLTKIYYDTWKMHSALWLMSNCTRYVVTSREYERARVEHIIRMSEYQKNNENNPFRFGVWTGRKHSAAARAKMSAVKMGKIPAEESIVATANANRGRKFDRPKKEIVKVYKSHSLEQCAKISATKRSQNLCGKNSKSSKRVVCLTTGDVFDCMKEAAQWAQCSRGNLTSCCKGDRKRAGCHPTTKELLSWSYYNG